MWGAPSSASIDTALTDGFTEIYLSAPPGFSSDPLFATFAADARAAGLTVVALAGDASWAKNTAPWLAWVDEVVASDSFDGILVDVEPYLLADWSNARKRSRVIRTYLRGLDGMAARASGLPVYAATPFWWDDPGLIKGKSLLIEKVLRRVDGIVVMAYRDHADGVDGIIDVAGNEVQLAAQTGKTAVISVQTAPDSLDKLTFFEEGKTALYQALDSVEATFSTSSGFGGAAVHYYAAYIALSP